MGEKRMKNKKKIDYWHAFFDYVFAFVGISVILIPFAVILRAIYYVLLYGVSGIPSIGLPNWYPLGSTLFVIILMNFINYIGMWEIQNG